MAYEMCRYLISDWHKGDKRADTIAKCNHKCTIRKNKTKMNLGQLKVYYGADVVLFLYQRFKCFKSSYYIYFQSKKERKMSGKK